MPPELIGGRYRVVRAIGQGGMGTVWLCRDEMLRRDVAVKRVGLLPGESVPDSARALREARSSAALGHRNVVTVFDVVDDAGGTWLVMEHVPSRSLADIIASDGPLDPAVVADIGAQVADGLAAAHAAGVMHRDVKPGNVLVREDGTAKISDFGIARSAGDPALTQSGFLTGTPSYFSPELARGHTPTTAADVWALGATLYAAVEGRPPYQARDNPIAVLQEIVQRQPAAPRRADFLEPVLLRMMDRDPGSRWTMDDARHALRRLATQHSVTASHTRLLRVDERSTSTAPATAGHPAGPADAPASAGVVSPEPAAGVAPREGGASAGSGPVDRSPSGPGPAEPGSGSGEPGPRSHDSGSAGAGAGGPRSSRPAPGSGPVGSGSEGRPRGRRGTYAVLLVLALLLVAGGIAYAVSRGGDDPGASGTSDGSATGTSTTRAPTPSDDASSASRSPSTSAASPSASSSASPSASSTGAASSGRVASFLRGYFAAAPGGSDAAWSQLGPGEQAQGRASYDRFWRSIESVEVSDVERVGGPGTDTQTVEATLTYRTTAGRVSTERHRLQLVRSDDGGYLIDADRVIS